MTADDIAQTRRNIRELTQVGEREIHEAVLSCTRARRQFLNSVPSKKPPLHRPHQLVKANGFSANWWI
jgi:hypothetical protein